MQRGTAKEDLIATLLTIREAYSLVGHDGLVEDADEILGVIEDYGE